MRRHTFAVALLLGGACLVSACSGSSTEPDSSADKLTSAEVKAALEAEGKNPAGKSEIKIGFINNEGGSAISVPEVRQGAEAAIAYANEYLGGIGGRTIVLDRCDTKGTPESSAACANRMIADDVPAVIMGLDANSGPTAQTVMDAGIPWITTGAITAQEIGGPLSFSLTGGALAFTGGLAQYFAERQEKDVAIFVIDVPAATSLMQDTIAFLEKRGVKASLVAIPAGAPDMTPQVLAALSKSPSVLMGVGDAGFCSSFMRAYETSGTKVPVALIGQCTGPEVTDSVSLEGAVSPVFADPNGDNKEAVLYRAIMQNYAPDVDQSGYATTGYTAALGMVRALAGISDPLTKETIAAKLHAAKDVVLPIADNVTFTCDGKQLPPFVAPCSSTVFVATLDEKGNPTNLVRVEPGNLLGG